MQCVNNISDLRQQVREWRTAGLKITLVPTMGNLHAGHLSLVRQALKSGDKTITSIFVNPTQFVEGEDYKEYPRTLDADIDSLEALGNDLVFNPDTKEIYPTDPDEQTRVIVPDLDSIFCGEFRPGHFSGVATVVSKLLNIVQPDAAMFGEKDYQQLLVIRRLVKDLCIPVEVISGSTVREDDGLALSSRNAYLTNDERKIAPLINRTLCEIADAIDRGDSDYVSLEGSAINSLGQAGFKVEYFKICDAGDLGRPGDGDLVVLAAAWLGRARLIDNVIISR